MSATLTILDITLGGLGFFLIYKIVNRYNESSLLPPGPKGLPVVGNILDMPSQKEWLTFARWGEKWGDILSASIFGQLFVIINNLDVARELLEGSGAINSDRSVIQMGGELVGWKNTLVLTPYGPRFRTFRKLFHQAIGTSSAMKQFHPVVEHETHKLLRRLSQNSEDLVAHIHRTVGAVILNISHGYNVAEMEDPIVTLADMATKQFSLSTTPGGFLVNLFPQLAALPGLFPGAGFKKLAKEWAHTLNEMANVPFQLVKDQMAAGTAKKSFTSTLLEDSVTQEEENDIKWAAASLYTVGADKTVSSIYAFFLAMTLFPEAQKEAQAEIDAVIGNGRLPNLGDRHKLPYVNALALEVLRWHSVTPTSVPHKTSADQVYRGYFIPKGTLIITNTWKMLHDPVDYPNPSFFSPERFLTSKGRAPEPDPREACFGFGRRICPGRVLADAFVFISCAMTLAVFDTSKFVENGATKDPTVDVTTGDISFKCSIVPRSDAAKALILADL